MTDAPLSAGPDPHVPPAGARMGDAVDFTQSSGQVRACFVLVMFAALIPQLQPRREQKPATNLLETAATTALLALALFSRRWKIHNTKPGNHTGSRKV